MTLCNRHRVFTEEDCRMCWLYEQIDSYRNTVKRLRKRNDELRTEVDIGQDRERDLQTRLDDLVDPPIKEARRREDMEARRGAEWKGGGIVSKWQAIQIEYLADSWWIVEEVNNHGQGGRRIIYCGDDEALAHRIARLPELEAEVESLHDGAEEIKRLRDAIDGNQGWAVEYERLRVQLASEAHGHKTMAAEVESLVAALFTIRRLTMRRDGLEHVVRVACDAIHNYDEPQRPAKAVEAAGKECCPECGADVEEDPREDGYTRWACGSNTGAWGFGRSQVCWERCEAAEAAGKKVEP